MLICAVGKEAAKFARRDFGGQYLVLTNHAYDIPGHPNLPDGLAVLDALSDRLGVCILVTESPCVLSWFNDKKDRVLVAMSDGLEPLSQFLEASYIEQGSVLQEW